MRILLTNNHLVRFGGSETWTLTMARELIKQGHQVGVYTHHKGAVSDLLQDYLDDNPQDYELALINHTSCTHVDARKKIFTSHSPFIDIEKPPAGMDAYVAVSEHIQHVYGIECLIRNPIDTELYRPTNAIKTSPELILSVTEVSLPFPTLRPSRYAETMPELMNQADLVVTIGRGVLEAMSCARNVIIYDERPQMGFKADGYLESTDMVTWNVGGRYALDSIDWDVELKKYKQEHGERNRDYILQHHDVKDIVNQYLNLV